MKSIGLCRTKRNKRIIESTAKRLGLSMDKVVLTVDEHANTSAASIPLALEYRAYAAARFSAAKLCCSKALAAALLGVRCC